MKNDNREANKFDFLEFFAGGGLARLGLGGNWNCIFANDISPKKAEAYRNNFDGASELRVEDVWKIKTSEIPGNPSLAWASFPCQDLSLAGNGNGLNAARSGAFWGFWKIIQTLRKEGRQVPFVVLENVVGLLSSKQGRDFASLCQSLADGGYFFGALVVDAVKFVPQSRPRLFIIAISKTAELDKSLHLKTPGRDWTSERLFGAYEKLTPLLKEHWIWWNLPNPPEMKSSLSDIVEAEPKTVAWHSQEETAKILRQMSKINHLKVKEAQNSGEKRIGAIYRRTRVENGARMQRTEVRFDGISGCLRTPVGGSSRQIIMEVFKKSIKTRLLSPREAARLMGVSDTYKLPENYNDAYHVMGDAVVAPAVSWLENHLLRPLAMLQSKNMVGAK